MPDVVLDAFVPDARADAVFERLSDFAAYPRFTTAVRDVSLRPLAPDTVEARWSVNFRNGVLHWTEQDTFDPAARTITFTQTDGDFETFSGSWRVEQSGRAAAVRFACTFDLGMPSLAAMIDPIASDTLVENLQLIVRGLLGDGVTFPTSGDRHEPAAVSADAVQ
jgi:ribosome-associated toxin RatA of RatAB toxin-antitoxin module